MDEMLESDNTQIFTQDVRTPHYICVDYVKEPLLYIPTCGHHIIFCVSQIMVQTAQRRQALGEVEARHREILRLEADIRVRPELASFPIRFMKWFSKSECAIC